MSQMNKRQNSRSYHECLAILPNRGFGGAQVADSGVQNHNEKEFFIDGRLAVGASEASDWFHEKTVRTPDESKRYFLFLVGAPGNGKSHIASALQRDLTPISKKSRRKHFRKHEYLSSTNQKVVVINDATIPAVGSDGSVLSNSLVRDIDAALKENHLLLVNVNRGIIYEELQADQTDGFARRIVNWLSEVHAPDFGDGWEVNADTKENGRNDSALRSLNVINSSNGLEASVLAVHVDRYSMLEEAPTVNKFGIGYDFPSMGNNYSVKRFRSRTKEFCSTTTAGILLSEFFSEAHFPSPKPDEALLIDPFSANVENFRIEEFRAGFQNLLRASEIVSSQKLTYRELWGAIVSSIIGVEIDPINWLIENQPPAELGRNRLDKMMLLASCRAHQSLFGVARVGLEGKPQFSRTPISILTGRIDPAFDAVPGTNDSESAGWASAVLDAFQAQSEGESILLALKGLLDESNDFASKAITEFDLQLDEVITQALDGTVSWLSDSEKQFVVAWYGEYLIRLYAVARGIPAFRSEISKYLDVRVEAQSSSALEASAASALRTLLLPYYSEDPSNRPVLLPLFEGRTEPIVDRTEKPKLVLKVHDRIDFEVSTRGDAINVHLKSEGVSMGRIPLDFALFREAFACVGNHAGYTELAESLTPRIERFRSSMLLDKQTAVFVSVNGPQLTKIFKD